jgi:uncharacterized protein
MHNVSITPIEKGENQELFEFPCEFPLKIMGKSEEDFKEIVLAIIRRHDPDLKEDTLTQRASRGGKYTSLTINVTAQSRTQLDALYQELSQHEKVKMVL